jgi:nucleotide-binding universal stress UspA family protein
MLDRILVPLDGSELADRILPYVERLASAGRSEVLLVRILDDFSVDDARLRGNDIFGAAEAKLAERVEALGRRGIAVRFDIRPGDDTAARILDCAEDYRPSVIALSSHGRTGADLWLRGSVAERLLRASRFPVFVVNPRARPSAASFARILVPLDGSELSEAVLPSVGEFAKVFGSEVVLLHALEEHPAAYPVASLSESPGDAQSVLERARRRIPDAKVRTLAVKGSPAFAILHAVETEKADLVALTTHGRSRISRWAFGSVAEHVLHQSRAPLLVVRTAGFGSAVELAAGALVAQDKTR